MRAVLISIRPEWCEKIANGRKTLELRKSFPRQKTPFKCYIYMTSGNASYPAMKNGAPYIVHNNGGQVVIGEFLCDYILHGCHMANADIAEVQSCVRREDIFQYSNGKAVYGWHISDLKIYDKPKELSEFFYPCEKHKYPYCFDCEHGLQAGDKRPLDGMRYYDVSCGNWLKSPPQSWCYVEDGEGK